LYEVVGVRFKKAGKIYYFDPDRLPIEKDCTVIVETARGVEYGKVVIGKKQVADSDVVLPLKKVIRVADDKDAKQVDENKQAAKNAFSVCQTKIREHKLDMKLVDVEYTFDRNKIIFYFTADGRVDFRELVKTWLLYSVLVSNFARLVYVTKPRCWAESDLVDDCCAVPRS
jgi:cell fate regulator YaaT (PSP1 superfamily)